MSKYVPDPEIDRLVHEMNHLLDGDVADDVRTDEPFLTELDEAAYRVVATGEELARLLREMARLEASDLILVPDSSPIVRINGSLQRLDHPVLGEKAVQGLFAPHVGARAQHQLAAKGAADFSLSLPAGPDQSEALRLRVNIQRQGGRLAVAIRALPQRIPSLNELGLPPHLADLVLPGNGLVLVCGPTGSGKSTTLAALLDHLNRTLFRHVVTIEEPVEYQHTNRQSVFEQVEIGSDSPSFGGALRSALRRDPDVILVGEMRDLETMATTITAAETGHLILSTLHTSDVAQAVHRIIDVFAGDQQAQVRHQLSLSLNAIVCQQLVPSADGGSRVPAVEVLHATYAVRNHIRRGNLDRIYNELLGGRSRGMISMEMSLADLVRSGKVDAEEARIRTSRPDELERLLSA
jgi:twitching motility protein PilT